MSRAYVGQCEFCGDGLLRLMACDQCGTIVAMCDECELIWLHVDEVADDPSIESSSAFPKCPACRAKQAGWSELDDDEIAEYEMEQFVAGRSD
ncbi:MAG: hypothetical protein KDA42_17555 [Planctomycetales bacterium]|nr:hypothetical protein [Planctomycetales bacterium]